MKQSKFKNKYDALLLDIDGTLVAYNYYAMPSQKVTDAIKKAQNKIIICLVTGRSYGFIEHILKQFGISSGFAIVNNGANVVNIKTRELIYDQPIKFSEVKKIIDLLRKEKVNFYLKQRFDHKAITDGYFKPREKTNKAYMITTEESFTSGEIEKLMKKLTLFSDLAVFKSSHKDPDKFGLLISHANATKVHGIYAIEKKLNISRENIIGVGDGYNDFPLLMACGLKIAMGNAVEDLKAIADYIAPTVGEDGVVDVIEKFVLNNEN